MGITSKEIAEIAGVSRGTVDRALHDRPGVKPSVAARIKEIASSMGYKANTMGQMLSLSKNEHCVGFLLPCLGNAFFDKLIEGIQKAADEAENYGIRCIIEKVEEYDED